MWSTSGKGREEMGADEEEVNEVEPKWNGSGSITANARLLMKTPRAKKKIHSLTGKTIRFLFNQMYPYQRSA